MEHLFVAVTFLMWSQIIGSSQGFWFGFVCFWKDTGLRSFYDNTTPAIFTTFADFCISPKAIVGKITIP